MKMETEQAEAFLSLKMDPTTKATGKMIRCQGMGDWSNPHATMKVISKMDSHMAKETTRILIKHIQASGETILSMDLGSRSSKIRKENLSALLSATDMKERASL